jgi:hypothetical protein
MATINYPTFSKPPLDSFSQALEDPAIVFKTDGNYTLSRPRLLGIRHIYTIDQILYDAIGELATMQGFIESVGTFEPFNWIHPISGISHECILLDIPEISYFRHNPDLISIGNIYSCRLSFQDRIPPFFPSSIEGLEFWIKAEAICGKNHGDPIPEWLDISGNGLQFAGGNSPSYFMNGLNGRPIVAFDGVNDFLEMTLPTNLNNPALTLVAICKSPSSLASDQIILSTANSANPNTGWIWYASKSGKHALVSASGPQIVEGQAISPNTPYLFIVERMKDSGAFSELSSQLSIYIGLKAPGSGSKIMLSANGIINPSGGGDISSFANNPDNKIYIGHDSIFSNLQIAEIMGFSRSLSKKAWDSLLAYAQALYGI